MKLRGINGHDNLAFAIIFEGRTLCDSSPNASAQYISASFRYRRPSAQRFCNHQTSVLSRFSSIIFDLRPHRKRFRPHGRPRTFCFRLTCRCKTLFRALPYFQGWRMPSLRVRRSSNRALAKCPDPTDCAGKFSQAACSVGREHWLDLYGGPSLAS